MYVYIYTYVYICVHLYIYIYIDAHIYVLCFLCALVANANVFHTKAYTKKLRFRPKSGSKFLSESESYSSPVKLLARHAYIEYTDITQCSISRYVFLDSRADPRIPMEAAGRGLARHVPGVAARHCASFSYCQCCRRPRRRCGSINFRLYACLVTRTN